MDNSIKEAIRKSGSSMYGSLPIIAGVILLVGLLKVLVPQSAFSALFSRNVAFDSITGSAIGSVLAGSPITSYIIGGEMLVQGVSLVAVTAFIVAWVTVGVVQLPAESVLLGKRFALLRNGISFVFAIIVAVITSLLVGLI